MPNDPTPNPHVIYTVTIADGYTDIEPPRYWYGAEDDASEEAAGYWYSYRHAENDCPTCNAGDEPPAPVECPDCDGGYMDADGEDIPCPTCEGDGYLTVVCPTCGGDGVVYGEPFTITRYVFNTEEDAEACASEVNDAGDGYERESVLARWARRPGVSAVVVLEWDRE